MSVSLLQVNSRQCVEGGENRSPQSFTFRKVRLPRRIYLVHFYPRRQPVRGTSPHEKSSISQVVGFFLTLINPNQVDRLSIELLPLNRNVRKRLASASHKVVDKFIELLVVNPYSLPVVIDSDENRSSPGVGKRNDSFEELVLFTRNLGLKLDLVIFSTAQYLVNIR